MRKNDLKYANFVCKFGELNLLDRLNEIVIPSFVNDALVRKRGSTNYLFINTSLENLGTRDQADYCIVGRFVKNTVLRRDQRLDEQSGRLVEDQQTLESAPSAFFVLRLLGHRVLYLAETTYAPSLEEFETTVRSRLKKTWNKYVNDQHKETGRTKTSIMEETPSPSLQITAMSGGIEVDEFVNKFSMIRSLEITVNPRNEEVDAGELSELIEHFRQEVGGETGKLTVRSPDGLDPESTKVALQELGQGGNQKTTLRGKDHQGDKLTGNEDDYSVVDHVEDPPEERLPRARTLMSMLREKAEAGVVKLGDVSQAAVNRIVRELNNE